MGKKVFINESEVVTLYLEGYSANALEHRLGVSRWKIRDVLVRNEVAIRTPIEGIRIGYATGKLKANKSFLWKHADEAIQYYKGGMSATAIAKLFGGRVPTIQHILHEKGIKMRLHDEASKLAVRRGEFHPNWKGGRAKTGAGYIKVKIPDYYRADKYGYVREHILVWEQSHNTLLPEGWVVHHFNGIRSDNRTENLFALPKPSHDKLIPEYQKHIRMLENQLKELRGIRRLL